MLSKPFAPVCLAAMAFAATAAGVVLPAPAEAAQQSPQLRLAAPQGHLRAGAFQSAAAPGWPILPANLRAPQGVKLGASSHRLRSGHRMGARAQARLRALQHRRAVIRWRVAHQAQLRHRHALRLAHGLRLAHAPAWGTRLRGHHPVLSRRVVPRFQVAALPRIARAHQALAPVAPAPSARFALGAARWDSVAQAFVVPYQGALPAAKLRVLRLNARWSYLDIPSARPAFGGVVWGQKPAPGVDRWVMAAQPGLRTTRVSLATALPTGWQVERQPGQLVLRPDSPQLLALAPRVPAGLALATLTPSVLPKLAGPVGVQREPKVPVRLALALPPAPVQAPTGDAGVRTGAPAAERARPDAPAPATTRASEQAAPTGSALAEAGVLAVPAGAAGAPAPLPGQAPAAEQAAPTDPSPSNATLPSPAKEAAQALDAPVPTAPTSGAPLPPAPVAPSNPQGEDALARSLDDGDTRLEAAETTREGHVALRFQGRTPAYRLRRISATSASLTFPASSLREPGVHTLAPQHHPSLQDGVVQQQGGEVRMDLRLTQEGRIGVYVDRHQRRLVVVMDGAPPSPAKAQSAPSSPESWPEPSPPEGSGQPAS